MTDPKAQPPRDYVVESWWQLMLQRGPTCLLKEDWRLIEDRLDPTTRASLKALIQSMDRQTRWIAERTKALRDEAEYIATIGATMKRAGLRSFTDENGRIFVAEEPA